MYTLCEDITYAMCVSCILGLIFGAILTYYDFTQIVGYGIVIAMVDYSILFMISVMPILVLYMIGYI
jgi:hypothetical protein